MKGKLLLLFIVHTLITSCIFMNDDDKIEDSIHSELNSFTNRRLENKVIEVKQLIKKESTYNAEIGFFIDMKIASAKNRFFVYNFTTKQIIDKGLVAHGSGSETGIEGKLQFSNTENSYCTSLGKYAIGNSYEGKFGKAYILYGLDKTNSNALTRNIVLHKYFEVPYTEQENNICNSLGCPMVNEKFYSRIEKLIDKSKKKIILTIYY